MLFICDVKVSFEEFRQAMVATCTSKTIITTNPGMWHNFKLFTLHSRLYISNPTSNFEIKMIRRLEKISPVGNYMFKVNNRNTRTRCEICSKLTIKTPEDMYYYTAIDKELSKKIFFRMLSNLLEIIYQSESRNVFGCHTSVFTL